MKEANTNWILLAGIVVLIPVFFQISGGLYQNENLVVDSQGNINNLPLPFSIFTVFLAFIFFQNSYKNTRVASYMMLGVVIVSLVSLWAGDDGVTSPERKLVAVLQMSFPLTGLLIGQLIEDNANTIAKSYLWVLLLIVPLQLIITWLQNADSLAHYLYLFTIYSHRQYVAVIFVCAYCYSLVSLWEIYKVRLSILTVAMFFYITYSLSFLAIVGYTLFVVTFFSFEIWTKKYKYIKYYIYTVVVVLVCLVMYKIVAEKTSINWNSEQFHHFFFNNKFRELAEGYLPYNIHERVSDWKLYGSGILDSSNTLFFGHSQPLPREIKSSPHNWYIEAVYNFGLIGLIPIFFLIGYTVNLCRLHSKNLSSKVWWLVAIVFYLVVIDSNFKVTLRQPYPGIFTFFMWGLLLSILRRHQENNFET